MRKANNKVKQYEKMQFGADLELNDTESRHSTTIARTLFFMLIAQRKTPVVFDLFRLFNEIESPDSVGFDANTVNQIGITFFSQVRHDALPSFKMSLPVEPAILATPLFHYYDYVSLKYADLCRIKAEITAADSGEAMSPSLLLDLSIRSLIPSWQNLVSDKDGEALCLSLEKWRSKWNLTEDWCSDFALTALGQMLVQLTEYSYIYDWLINANDREQILNRFQQQKIKAWISAANNFVVSLGKSIDTHTFYTALEKYPQFEFQWDELKIETVWYPAVHKTAKEFETKMEEDFWTQFFTHFGRQRFLLTGQMTKVLTKLEQFKSSLNNYIENIKRINENFTVKTPIKREGELHFEWFIDYQIPPCKSFLILAKENDCDRRAIERAIKNVCELLIFKLRLSSSGGRRLGSRDTRKRVRRN
jgi:hypothetical protein